MMVLLLKSLQLYREEKDMRGFLFGIMICILTIVGIFCFWLYGDKIKQDFKDKFNNSTVEQENKDTSSYITLELIKVV